MLTFQTTIVAVIGYLLGAIPFAVIISKRHGIDILKEGSGNPGATNVKRVVGKGAGNLCFTMDALKGVVATGWPILVFHGNGYAVELGVLGLIAALVGHSFSMFIHFKGGKGVATSIGGMLALCPLVIIIGVLVWLAIFYWKRYVSLASLCMAASLPVAAFLLGKFVGDSWFFGSRPIVFWFSLLIAVILFVRHRSNIARLWSGEENKFSKTLK